MKKILLAAGLLVSTLSFSQTKLTFDLYGFGGQSFGTATDPVGDKADTEGFNLGGGFGVQYNVWGDVHVGVDLIGLGSLNQVKESKIDFKFATMNALLFRLSYTLGMPVGEWYASVGAGIYNITGPELKAEEIVIQKETTASNFGFSPEVGIRILGFMLGASYTMAGEVEFELGDTAKLIYPNSSKSKQEYNFWSVKVGYSFSVGL